MTTTRVPLRFGPSEVSLATAPDGTIRLRSPHALGPQPRSMIELLDTWAAATPDRVFLQQRDASGAWARVTYAGARALARNLAAAFLARGLSPERPIAILSGNGLEHALIGLGAMIASVPFASISPAYSLISTDFAKLKAIIGQLTPGLVFTVNGAPFAKAIAAAIPDDAELVMLENPPEGRPATKLDALWTTPAGPEVDAAAAKVGPDTIAKLLFTSGSTGTPKGVINTQRMLTANQVMIATAYPSLADVPPVLVDWLPWSHTFGGNHNLGIVMMHGGTFVIDDGKPLPGAIEVTVRNLREIAPTVYYNVPKGYEMLLPYLRREPELRRTLFSRLQFMFYAGASLAADVREELERMALETVGAAVPMITSFGSTETAPSALNVTRKATGPGVIGTPNVGVEMKLVPADGKLEARVKGPNVTPGYWRRPDLTKSAFDEEGYYRFGDAMRLADPADPEKGLVFDGRIAEDFKLSTGTWVSVGPLRQRVIEHLAPLVRDVVIAGHDRDDASALLIPDLDACRAVAGLDAAAKPADVVASAAVVRAVSAGLARLNANAGGTSWRIFRALVVHEPLSIDTGEVTDKGSINQRAVLGQRTGLVGELYADPPSARVIRPATA